MQGGTLMLVSVCLGSLIIGLCPQKCVGKQKIEVEVGSERIGKYEKIKFLIHLDTIYDNPFDPEEVDLSLDFRTPSGETVTIPAFYYQDYEKRHIDRGGRKTDWLYPVGDPVWKARFAPVEVGKYSCIVRLKDRNGTAQSDTVSFECIPSQSKGFIRVAEKDPRFLEFTEGTSFFPIGQNLAFIGQTQYVDVHKMESTFREMSQNGANYARIWTCCEDWAMAIEARKSAWGRSWDWNPPVALMPGREGYHSRQKCIKLSGEDSASVSLSPCHPVALRPSTRYVFSCAIRVDGEAELQLEVNNTRIDEITGQKNRWTEFKTEFTTSPDEWWLHKMLFRLAGKGSAWLRSLSLKEADGGPELLWEADLDRPAMGYYNPVDCFMLDKTIEAAEGNGIYLQLCFITRDLYMDSLKDEDSPDYYKAIQYGKKLLRYVVARWGYSTSVATWEYFNEMNPNLPTGMFYAEMSDHLEQIDVYDHLRATSAWAPCEKDWKNPKLDVADFHWYLRPAWGEIWKDEVASVIDRADLLRKHATSKPALLSEFGLADDRWGLSPYMKQDEELVHFHNALWASSLSGLSGTALFWWWEQLDMQSAYSHYRPLASFLAHIPFTTAELHQISATVSHQQARVIGLQGKDRAYAWLFNTRATWANQVIEKAIPTEIEGVILKIEGLAPGAYQVQWWDTYKGEIIKEETSESEQILEIPAPAFTRDIACKVIKRDGHE